MPAAAPDDHPVLLFDGVCNLCNGFVQFIIRRDPVGTIRFAPLQSAPGRELLERCGLPDDHLESLVLVEGDDYSTRSTAALRVAQYLRFPWPLLAGLGVIPRPIRDRVYDWLADRRYAWFGRREECMVPTPELEARFLETSP